jgi:hypothetical protein
MKKKMIYLFANGQHPDDLIDEVAVYFEQELWCQMCSAWTAWPSTDRRIRSVGEYPHQSGEAAIRPC